MLTRVECQAELSELTVGPQGEVEVAPAGFDDPDFIFPIGVATDLNADGRSDLVLRPSASQLLVRVTPDDTLRELRPSATALDEPSGYGLFGVVAVQGQVYMVLQGLGLEDDNAVLFVPYDGEGVAEEAAGSFPLSSTFSTDGSLGSALLDPIPTEAVFFRLRAEGDLPATDLWHLTLHGP